MSDEVSQFLESVERLRGQQIEEDEVRARELEEYLAAKRERQARREGQFFSSLFYFPHQCRPRPTLLSPAPDFKSGVAAAATLDSRFTSRHDNQSLLLVASQLNAKPL